MEIIRKPTSEYIGEKLTLSTYYDPKKVSVTSWKLCNMAENSLNNYDLDSLFSRLLLFYDVMRFRKAKLNIYLSDNRILVEPQNSIFPDFIVEPNYMQEH